MTEWCLVNVNLNWVFENGIMKFLKNQFLLKFIAAAILDE